MTNNVPLQTRLCGSRMVYWVVLALKAALVDLESTVGDRVQRVMGSQRSGFDMWCTGYRDRDLEAAMYREQLSMTDRMANFLNGPCFSNTHVHAFPLVPERNP